MLSTGDGPGWVAEEDWNFRPVLHVLESSPTWLMELWEVNKTGVGEGHTELGSKSCQALEGENPRSSTVLTSPSGFQVHCRLLKCSILPLLLWVHSSFLAEFWDVLQQTQLLNLPGELSYSSAENRQENRNFIHNSVQNPPTWSFISTFTLIMCTESVVLLV